ncbi:MAG: hypothetical protein CFE26_13185 [Verrucomicrobiales bacterium VVV1]|nr:MAG: hypothetical protein CFE26_13185 [Verrucomicrobiales bacterium VVV1]
MTIDELRLLIFDLILIGRSITSKIQNLSRQFIPAKPMATTDSRQATADRQSPPLRASAPVLSLESSSLESLSFIFPLPFKLNTDLSFIASATKET